MPDLRVALLTREYPPEVYGGAGVHVEYLARELVRLLEVTVHAWGADRRAPGPGEPPVVSYRPWDALAGAEPYAAALRALSIDLAMAAGVEGADLVHSHTWYANLAGHLARLVHGVPHVRDRAQPGADAALEGRAARRRLCRCRAFAEQTGLEGADAVIAVSAEMRRDLLRVYPAIDPARVSRDPQRDRHGRVPARPGDGRARAPRDRPGPAVGPVRRPDHPPEGARPPARRGRGVRPARAARPRCRRAGHARDRRRDGRPRRAPARRPRRDRLDHRDGAARPT